MTDTIFALATAPGRAGVSVVRVSGPLAHDSLAFLSGIADPPIPRHATLTTLVNPDTGLTLDHAIVLSFRGPASFTGEDIVEYQLHGSPAVVRILLSALSAQRGHRLAQPGEFTRRAFENGRIDLTAAEAIADLVNAETELQQQQAIAQMDGSLSGIYGNWRERLSRALAHIEADIDFPDEDLPDGVAGAVRPVITDIASQISIHLDDGQRGEILRDGFRVVIVGAPNAGKSSLLNMLARRDVAIVSEFAGTTRDVIECQMNLGGYPVVVADTAGLRPGQMGSGSQDVIEVEGMRRAVEQAGRADLKILLFDGSLPDLNADTLALQDDRSMAVFSKSDLSAGIQAPDDTIRISAKTGDGLDILITSIISRIEDIIPRTAPPSLTRQRHRESLSACLASLQHALSAPAPELMAEDIRLAVRALGRITGHVDVEDLLDIIFRDFCIGK